MTVEMPKGTGCRAVMVSNLLVVLVGDQEAQAAVTTSSFYQGRAGGRASRAVRRQVNELAHRRVRRPGGAAASARREES